MYISHRSLPHIFVLNIRGPNVSLDDNIRRYRTFKHYISEEVFLLKLN